MPDDNDTGIYIGDRRFSNSEKVLTQKLSDILLTGLFAYLGNGEDYVDTMVLFAESQWETAAQNTLLKELNSYG